MYIERLTGTFIASLPTGIILEVHDIGYGLELPLSALCVLPRVGERISLWVYTHIKEDSIRLFGFKSFEDRQAFEILLSLSGVGPKVALAILSTLSVSAIERAVLHNEGKILETVPGVGARMAERILLEIKPKMMKLKAAHLLDMRQGGEVMRFAESNFDPLLNLVESNTEVENDIIFSDLASALENLGYKDKVIVPILMKIKKENVAAFNLQDLMRLALKHLSYGFIENSNDTSKSKDKKFNQLDLGEAEVF